MKQVNPWYIDALLDPLAGLADDDEEWHKYENINPFDEASLRNIIRTSLVPNFKRYDPRSKEISKLSFRYYLTKPNTDFERLFYAHLLPFSAPADPRLFFVWLWEELFPGEEYHLDNLKEYQVNADIHAPNLIKYGPEESPSDLTTS